MIASWHFKESVSLTYNVLIQVVRLAGGLRYLKANLVSGRVKPIGNWFYRAVDSTTSASIRWIRLIICLRISRVLSLSVLFASHHMIGWCKYLWQWRCMQLYDKTFFYSSLPFLLVCRFCVWFSLFTMIINLLIGADMRTPRGRQGDGDSAA